MRSAKLEGHYSSVIKGRAREVAQEPCKRVCSSRKEKALGLCLTEEESEGGTLCVLVLLP